MGNLLKNKATDEGGVTIEIAIIWCIEDISYCASEMGKGITREQAGDILDKLLNKHDADQGISWETLRICIQALVDE